MEFFGWFRKDKKETAPEDIACLAREMNPLIDGLIRDIFSKYHETLLKEKITYIVYAVWGARSDGEIDAIQREINGMTFPVIRQVSAILEMNNASPEKKYAVEYLVRSLIISKITYTIELARSVVKNAPEIERSNENDSADTNESLEKMIDYFLPQSDMSWRKKFGKNE